MSSSGLIKPTNEFPLVDVKEPNLLRHEFPYSGVPKITFDGKILPISVPEDFWITDTTFRDGQQARPPYSVKQIVDIFDLLHRLGGPNGVIRQSEFFLYSQKDREAVEKCLEMGHRFPEVTGWIRAVKKDFQLVKDMGLKETGILTSVSDYHIFLKLNRTRRQCMEDYLDVVRASIEAGVKPRCHFEDVTRADIYGFVVPFAIELMKLSEESKMPIKIRLCDTMGYGVTYPGAALPRAIDKLVRSMTDDAGVPPEELEWHGHNDFHKVHINAATAWLYGCSAANGALLGFGERTGNPPIEALIIEYLSLKGDNNGIDTTVITEIADYFKKELKYRIPPNYPFVGEDFNVTRAGIHADGVLKNEEIYNIFDTAALLKRPLGVMVTDKSGLAGIASWTNMHLGLEGEKKIDKRHPGVAKINKWVMAEFEKGRETSVSTEEMERLAHKYLPELFVSELDRLKIKAREWATHFIEKVLEDGAMRTMKPTEMEPVMKRLVEEHPFIQLAYVINLEGVKITRNITQVLDKAKYEHFGVGEDFSDRSWFIEPLRDGKIHVTDFYTSKITGALCITASAPIRNEREEIVGVFGIDIKFEDLVKAEEDEEE
ncbi:MAG TPA: histone-lysine N-methyltransferase [Thermodesulfobacteriota bacterium]|nr:histone-lysine N-methyltransferase [Thermodesulfobacteriota bacterium]